MSVKDNIRLAFLRFKSRISKLKDSKILGFILKMEIGFIFLFLSLKLFGYEWNWVVLIACFGAWFVYKEIVNDIIKIMRASKEK